MSRLPAVDAVIVGAGAAGGIVAQELSKAGLRVALLERGKRYRFAETEHDELRSQRTTVLGNAFGPDDERHRRLVKLGDDTEFRRVTASDGGYGNVAACVGGGTLSYGAMAWRYTEKDFRMRSTYGALEGSTLEDWPISYADLEPYYTKAEWEIGVSGQAGANPFDPPRSKPYPMPPLPYNREASILGPAARKLGLHPFPIPMAINSKPYDGRPACIGCLHCVGFACEVNAKGSTAVNVIPRAIQTGNCDLRTECVVKEVLLDAKGNATGVSYFKDRQLYEQPARIVVVSCSATESARLLLNSRNKVHPTGIGNQADWVGRNLQGHAYAGAVGIFEHETYDGIGPGARIAVCDFNHGNPGIKGGAMLANEFIRLPYLFSRTMVPPRMKKWGGDYKRWLATHYKRTMSVKGPIQEMPTWETRVEVDASVRDAWGIPVAKLTGKRHPHDLEAGKFIAAKAEEWLKAAGAVETWTTLPGKGNGGGQHQAGTCRMSADAKTGVVDTTCRVHTADNIYVIDGSVHVTNGGFNPSLTIQAIAFRAAAELARTWRKV
ncbi:MAG TPA: GMC family oxidoreductase [Bryobacteraceae bacterium]|nr:GMC family oxidoreductase [Bryobacteraceae bacterium]